MGIFEWLFGKKKKVNPENLEEEYLNLAEMLIENSDPKAIERFKDKLSDWKNNPETIMDDGEYYYDTGNQAYQVYRGDSKELFENIHWFLMIDSLVFEKNISELDWKTEKADALGFINLLAEKKSYSLPKIDLSTPENTVDLKPFFIKINKQLNSKGLSLIDLDINSDSYVFALIKKENRKKIIAKAEFLNQRIYAY